MRHIGWTISRFVCFGLGSALLYYGVGFLLFVPDIPGELYWRWERWIYGVLPISLSVTTVLLSTWLAIQMPPHSQSNGGLEPDPVLIVMKSSAYTGVGAVVVLFLLSLKDLLIQ